MVYFIFLFKELFFKNSEIELIISNKMSTGEIENHPADDPLNESDEFLRSMESVNYKVYEVSKLVNRI